MRSFGEARRRPGAGFTLVELMIVVAIVGILAVLAVFGVRRYVANAKTAEARNALGQIATQATLAFEKERWNAASTLPDGDASGATRVLCATAVPVPPTVPGGAKYQSTPTDWQSGDVTSGWTCLQFALSAPQYFQYGYERSSATRFEAVAHGDLDGDGNASTLSLGGAVEAGRLKTAPAIAEVSPEE